MGGVSGELVHASVECQFSTLSLRQSVITAAGSPDVRYPPRYDLVSFPMSTQFPRSHEIHPPGEPGGFGELDPEIGYHQRDSTIRCRLIFRSSLRESLLVPTVRPGVLER